MGYTIALPNAGYFDYSVYSVCFDSGGKCKDDCYSPCDNGTPNIPNCNSSSTSSNTNSFNGSNQNSSQQTQVQKIVNQQEQERQQQELKRQQDAQRTAAYVDLGVQTIKSVAGLISSLREEKKAQKESENEQKIANNYAKGDAIFDEINELNSEFIKNNDAKKAENIGSLFLDLASNQEFYAPKPLDEYGRTLPQVYRENGYIWYIKSFELGNISYNLVKKVLDHYSNPFNFKDESSRGINYNEVFNHIVIQFDNFKDEGNKEKYFDFAKILAEPFYDIEKNKFDLTSLIEFKKKEKFWLEKAVEMNHPLALAVIAKYYEYGDFFTKKTMICSTLLS